MRWILICLALSLVGCHFETGLEPATEVIAESSARDFGFSGSWLFAEEVEGDQKSEVVELTIKKDKDYKAVAINTKEPDLKSPTVTFRAEEVDKDLPYAIIEFEHKGIWGDGVVQRRLAIAHVDDDTLHISTIDRHKLGEILFEDGATAVIEHSSDSSKVHCESKQLLKTIGQHLKELANPHLKLKRKPDAGG